MATNARKRRDCPFPCTSARFKGLPSPIHADASLLDGETSEPKDETDESSNMSQDSCQSVYVFKRLRTGGIQLQPFVNHLDCSDTSTEATIDEKLPHYMYYSPKPPPGILDIDDPSTSSVDSTYEKQIIEFKRSMEHECVLSNNYLETINSGLSERMRSMLVDWMIDVSINEFKMQISTVHLAVVILDKVLCLTQVDRANMQLYGAASLLLAGKLEETVAPPIHGLVYFADKAFTSDQVTKTESKIWSSLSFNCYLPTRVNFLDRYLRAGEANTREIHFANYILDLSLMEYSLGFYEPSLVAAAAIHLTRQMLHCRKQPVWTVNLQYHSGYSERALESVVHALRSLHESISSRGLWAVYKCYEGHDRSYAALQFPLKKEHMRFGFGTGASSGTNFTHPA